MKKRLTHFDIYDIFNFPDNGDTCRFDSFHLEKEEFLSGAFLDNNLLPVKELLIYIYMPVNNEPTMNELAGFFEILAYKLKCKDITWGVSSDDEISRFKVFVIKTY